MPYRGVLVRLDVEMLRLFACDALKGVHSVVAVTRDPPGREKKLTS